MAGHWRQAFWSGFFEEPDFRPFVSKVETLQKEASDAWGAYICYSRRHGRRLQTLDWRKSHLWYNPAPERVGDHLLWVFPGSYVNGLVETIYREIQSLFIYRWKMIKVKVISQVFLSTKFAICFFSDLDSLRELPLISLHRLNNPKVAPRRVLHPPIPSNFFSDTPSFTCDIAWYYMILHDITCIYTNDCTCNML